MISDYSKYTTAGAAPSSGNMLQQFRDVGYNMEAVVAGILGNSISAGVKK